ncbi:hypothetical protein SAMN05428961_11722 [Paenibacillus sp. OK060]|uniref:hypothetical protein n=1 Tax=Paenibacillus sp. OK060 TaxID=1881034 RepID=UPI00088B36BD|nr:hypothetical protein [Paenibacillus sp. OK060]SDM42214.1 hypothetical protein SAMN05428961_11722 [Paenibacillus sp. OK060]
MMVEVLLSLNSHTSIKVFVNDKKVEFTNKLLRYEESNLVSLLDISKALGAHLHMILGVEQKEKYKVTIPYDSKNGILE